MAPILMGTIFNIMRFAVNDGPGIRTTVFLKGCPLDCWWCHNPESQVYEPELQIWPDRCIGCGACVKACPQRSAVETDVESNPAPQAPPGCTACGRCAAVCPSKAREILGWRASVDDIMQEVARDTVFYDESGGGATFSGGEPLAQPEFLLALLQACRARGIHTCVDTCGYAPLETLLAVAAYTDLFLYDLKLMDCEQHVRYTGAPNGLVLDNLAALSAVHPGVTVRMPVIPGINDGRDNIVRAGEFLSGLKGLRDVTLLPYHATGTAKYARLGRPCRLEGVEPPPPGSLEEIARRLEAYGLRVQIGG